MSRTFGVPVHHFQADPNRPPMTMDEAKDLAQKIGALKRGARTIAIAKDGIAKYEDRADKKSDSGLLVNAGIKCLSSALYWLDQAVDVLGSAHKYAKEGK